ncbi:MAG TPA: D-alanyl-D-alanine carboxypeptidase family protein [Casimicrobiaceae bacterium]|jgi:D-alanyl-D-alanine carboxypeptidase (penicillin-binding protein 5/6)|nr:D-alanyl-D-alanine carboxypeptidase family protein [Casimicrobiaceae bacterium]
MSWSASRWLTLLFACVGATAAAQTVPAAAAPPPEIAAKSYLLVDVLSGQTLVAQNADEPREPASLTKLMTAYLVFGALKDKQLVPSQMVPVSEAAWRAEGSRMFIDPKKAVSVDELLRGEIVQSGNDAAIALAEAVAGSEEAFVARMNREAARLGMTNTRFGNATGLPLPQQASTAADLARVATAIIRDFPEYYPLYSLKEYRYNNITQSNRNRLLWTDPFVDGMKTGYTDAAGYCLVASAKRGPRRLLSVVLGAGSNAARASESQKLLNYGFQFYDTVQLYQSGQPISTLRIWKGAANSVPAGFVADQYVTLPKNQARQLKLTLVAVEPLLAPVTRGQRVGTVNVTLEGKPVGEYPLLALADVGPASFFGSLWDTLRLWFK